MRLHSIVVGYLNAAQRPATLCCGITILLTRTDRWRRQESFCARLCVRCSVAVNACSGTADVALGDYGADHIARLCFATILVRWKGLSCTRAPAAHAASSSGGNSGSAGWPILKSTSGVTNRPRNVFEPPATAAKLSLRQNRRPPAGVPLGLRRFAELFLRPVRAASAGSGRPVLSPQSFPVAPWSSAYSGRSLACMPGRLLGQSWWCHCRPGA